MVIFMPGIKAKAATQGYEKIEVNYDESSSTSGTKIAGIYFWYETDNDGYDILYQSRSKEKKDGIALTDLTSDGNWGGLSDAWTNGTYIYYTKGTRTSLSKGTVTLYRMTISTQKIKTIGSFSAEEHTETSGGYYGILGIYDSKIYIGFNLNNIYVIDTKKVKSGNIVPTEFRSKIDLSDNDLASMWDDYNGAGSSYLTNDPSGPQSLYHGRYLLYSSGHKLYTYDLKTGTEKKLATSCYGWKVYEANSKYAYIRLWRYVEDEKNINESDRFYKLTLSTLKMKIILSQDFCYDKQNDGDCIYNYTADEIVYFDTDKDTYYRLKSDGTKEELTQQDIYDHYW